MVLAKTIVDWKALFWSTIVLILKFISYKLTNTSFTAIRENFYQFFHIFYIFCTMTKNAQIFVHFFNTKSFILYTFFYYLSYPSSLILASASSTNFLFCFCCLSLPNTSLLFVNSIVIFPFSSTSISPAANMSVLSKDSLAFS